MTRRLPCAVLVLVGLASVASCTRPERPPEMASAAPVVVRTARVGGGNEGWIEVPGVVEAARAADIASRVSAVVETVNVEEGAFVRAGDLLVGLDGRDLMARLAGAEANLQAATAQRDRIRALFASGAATQQEKEAAEAAHAVALADRDAAKAQIGYVEFRAPFDGFVVNKKTRVGDLTVPGQPLLSVQGVGLLRVAATVTRPQANRLRRGQPIDAVLEGGAVVASRLSVLAPAGDPSSLRFLVKADLPGGSGAWVGSFARLRLSRGDEEPTPFVPRAAVVERGALSGVYVVENGRARLRFVSLGEPAVDLVPVRSGLSAGEEIVLDPGSLADGAAVERRP